MNVKIEDSWKKALGEEFEKDYFRTLVDFVKREYASSQVFPPGNEIFAAFDATPFDRVKVVILGQDPYHGEHQANGLCFSVNDIKGNEVKVLKSTRCCKFFRRRCSTFSKR